MELASAVWQRVSVSAYQRDVVGGLVVQLLRQLLVVLDEMRHVDVAEVLL
jgi:hypothetical protein